MRAFPGIAARPCLLITVVALLCALVPMPAAAAPSTPAIEAKQAQAAAAQAKLADLDDQFEMKVEEYNAITEALDQTRGQIEQTNGQLERANGLLSESQERLATRATARYKGGGIDLVDVLLGTTSFQDFLTRLDILNRISDSDADLVGQVSDYRERVAASEVTLENREAEQVALRQEARAKKAEVENARREQKAYVDSLNADIARLVKEEEARQRRLAEERARAAEELARRAAEQARGSRDGSATPGAPHPEVVAVALKYLGVKYVWGGSSPSGFDCSGLTSYSYAQIGIDIPRTSRSQFRVGTFIAADRRDRLEPGDLVFFGYGGDAGRIHHVGIYVGNGDFVHAPASGDVVRVSSLTERIASRGDYVGAVRP